MKLDELIKKIKNEFKIDMDKFKILDNQKFSVIIESERIPSFLSYLKQIGFSQLSLLTCVDWIEKKQFEIVYILISWELKLNIIVKTYINRDKPEITTIQTIYPAAKYYERDVWEFFGVVFTGNKDLKPLFLEYWDDIPPMRKDFDPLAYSEKKFGVRNYKVDIHVKNGK